MKNTEKAFQWVVEILQKLQIPFQITGGFAARVYGVKRELQDIDFDIPEDRFAELAEAVKEYIVFGPSRYNDSDWNLYLMTISYEDQDIDFGALEARIFDRSKNQWVILKANLSTAKEMDVYGLKIPVVNRAELIQYKKILARDVDLSDIEQLTQI